MTQHKPSGRLLIVTYHYVREQGGVYPGIHPVSARELSIHINKLKQKYYPASIEQISDFILGKAPLEQDSFLITFDDGLQDHYKNTRHVLNEHNISSVFFVPTLAYATGVAPAVHKIHWLRANTSPDEFTTLLNETLPGQWSNLRLTKNDQIKASKMHINDNFKTQVLKFSLNFIIPHDIVNKTMSQIFIKKNINEKVFCRNTFMDAKQIYALEEDGHIIAMHGHTHTAFTSLNSKELDSDIEENATILQSIINRRPTWISYPYGRSDAIPDHAEELCKKHEIDVSFSMIGGLNQFGDSSVMLKRITPNEINKYLV